jgi:hypothetical protein
VQTIAFQRGTAVGAPYLLLLHSAQQPSAPEWSAYVQAAQRKQLAEAFDKSATPGLTHVFSTSAFVRGVVTAFSWMTRSHALAHAPREFGSVCVESQLDATSVLGDLVRLQQTFVAVQVLSQIQHMYTRRASLPRR